MSKRNDEHLVLDILESIRRVQEYTQGQTYQKFSNDLKTQDSVVRNLEIIGEAVKSFSQDFVTQYSDIPWSQIARMRDKLIHHYFGVNYDIIWDVIHESLPALQDKLNAVLDEFEG